VDGRVLLAATRHPVHDLETGRWRHTGDYSSRPPPRRDGGTVARGL
jgi:hypothetical protein